MAQNSSRNLKDQLAALLSDSGDLPDYSLPEMWRENTLFIRCKDVTLSEITKGRFPGLSNKKPLQEKNTHPAFLLKCMGNLCFKFCPCTSKRGKYRYISKGTKLLYSSSNRSTDKDSFILERFSFNVVEKNTVVGPDNYFGVVPESAIINSANS